MSLHRMLMARAAEANPLRIGVIGAGKFGSMYLSQIPTTPGIHLLGIADLSPTRARENLARLGWKPEFSRDCGLRMVRAGRPGRRGVSWGYFGGQDRYQAALRGVCVRPWPATLLDCRSATARRMMARAGKDRGLKNARIAADLEAPPILLPA